MVMFFLQIDDLSVEMIAKTASLSGIPMKAVVKLALLKGLAELGKMEGKKIAEIKSELNAELSEAEQYISANWKTMSDLEMAKKLGIHPTRVKRIRYDLGLFRQIGRPQAPQANDRRLFVEDNWQTMSDKEMSDNMGISAFNVRAIRHKLGFLRRKKTKTNINVDLLTRALLEEGETLASFAQKNKLTGAVSKQRISQICEINGIDISKDRKPVWYAKRYNCPVLADKDQLATLLNEYRSVPAMAALLQVGPFLLKKILSMHQIDFGGVLRGKAPRVELTCSNPDCQKKFFRTKKSFTVSQKKNPNHVPYCSKKCFGHVLGEKFGWGRKISL